MRESEGRWVGSWNLKALFFVILIVFYCLPSTPAFPESLDLRWYRQIHDRWHSKGLDPLMRGATQAGEPAVGLAFCLGGSAFGRKRERESAKLATVALAGSSLVTVGLKGGVNRMRPDGEEGRWDSSFPSGHATVAFALATLVSARYRKLAVPAYLGATLIGVSRIYLGRHYPLDAAGGAVVGIASGYLVMRFQKPILAFEL